MRRTSYVHGTRSSYNHHGCRCDRCTEANRLYVRGLIAARAGKPLPSDVQHGTNNAYLNYGCRCPACRTWSRDHATAERAAKKEKKK